jgi:hypothetical protein
LFKTGLKQALFYMQDEGGIMKKKLALALLMAALLAGGAFAQEWYNSYAPGIDGSMFLINAGVGWGNLW